MWCVLWLDQARCAMYSCTARLIGCSHASLYDITPYSIIHIALSSHNGWSQNYYYCEAIMWMNRVSDDHYHMNQCVHHTYPLPTWYPYSIATPLACTIIVVTCISHHMYEWSMIGVYQWWPWPMLMSYGLSVCQWPLIDHMNGARTFPLVYSWLTLLLPTYWRLIYACAPMHPHTHVFTSQHSTARAMCASSVMIAWYAIGQWCPLLVRSFIHSFIHYHAHI